MIAGPTASGKTALALALAQRLGAEIVSADSQQVYRYFDIGTAKPSAAELSQAPHHLISVIEPTARFSAAQYQALADGALGEIAARTRPAVVVGGTGLYLRVLLHGVIKAPGADPAVRQQLEALSDEELHQRLRAVDPKTAEKLPPRDRVRAIRALEIHTLSGEPASAARERHRFAANRYPYRMWVLEPDRQALYAAINARTEAMYRAGLVEETRALVELGFREAAPMRSVGYAEALQVIDGTLKPERAAELTAQATRHYAKRQLTWFRKEIGATFVRPPFGVEALLEPQAG